MHSALSCSRSAGVQRYAAVGTRRTLRAGSRTGVRRSLPLQLRVDAAARRAVPGQRRAVLVDARLRPGLDGRPVSAVHAADVQQHHGHREHLRAGRQAALQRRRVGQKHTVLPRPTGMIVYTVLLYTLSLSPV